MWTEPRGSTEAAEREHQNSTESGSEYIPNKIPYRRDQPEEKVLFGLPGHLMLQLPDNEVHFLRLHGFQKSGRGAGHPQQLFE